jgi:hypothetical protein
MSGQVGPLLERDLAAIEPQDRRMFVRPVFGLSRSVSIQQQPELPSLDKFIVRSVQFRPSELFFPSLFCVLSEQRNSSERALFWPRGKKQLELYDPFRW